VAEIGGWNFVPTWQCRLPWSRQSPKLTFKDKRSGCAAFALEVSLAAIDADFKQTAAGRKPFQHALQATSARRATAARSCALGYLLNTLQVVSIDGCVNLAF
jgi:hypothetical protein